MTKTIGINDLKKVAFYQMPKVFFQDSKYKAMHNDAKLTYMLLKDLLPLSTANNWVNEDGDIYVKISRKKLMELLNIKGTQKFAKIMKELTDYNLILYKKMGLSQCNEIYIYPLEPSQDVDNSVDSSVDKIKDVENQSSNDDIQPPNISFSNPVNSENQTYINNNSINNNYINNNISQSVSHIKEQADKMTDHKNLLNDLKKLEGHLESQIHVEDLKQRYDESIVDEVINNIGDMYISKITRVNRRDLPQSIIRSAISKLEMHHIEHVIDQFCDAATQYEIRNTKSYIQTLIYNSIFEANTKILGNINYHMGQGTCSLKKEDVTYDQYYKCF